MVGVVALDGVPIHEAGNEPRDVVWRSHLAIPPAGRVEFNVKGPAIGTSASLVTRTVDTGPAGENDPTRPLATIIVKPDAPATRSQLPILSVPTAAVRNLESPIASLGNPPAVGSNPHWVGNFPAVHERKLFFSEDAARSGKSEQPDKVLHHGGRANFKAVRYE